MKAILMTCIVLLTTFQMVLGQTSCTQTLITARSIYAEGRIHELPDLLSGCIKKGFTDEEKTEAYKLLVLSHIYLDETEKADNSMLDLLNHNHEFQLNEQADPAEFINLYNTFRTWPIYLWGVKVGGTYSFANVQKLFGVNSSLNERTDYSPLANVEAGFVFEKGFKGKRLGAMAELLFTRNQYEVIKEFSSDPSISDTGDQIEVKTFAKTTSTETKNWLSLNLAGYYNILPSSQLKPRVFLGPSISYLILDNAEIKTEFPEGGEQATGPDADLSDFRNPINFGVMAGVGIRTKVGKYFLFFQGKYIHGLMNITEFNYDQSRLSTFYGYSLDDVKVSYFSLSLGLLFQKYNPKKLKN